MINLSNWQSLVDEAIQQAGYRCDDSVQHYFSAHARYLLKIITYQHYS